MFNSSAKLLATALKDIDMSAVKELKINWMEHPDIRTSCLFPVITIVFK